MNADTKWRLCLLCQHQQGLVSRGLVVYARVQVDGIAARYVLLSKGAHAYVVGAAYTDALVIRQHATSFSSHCVCNKSGTVDGTAEGVEHSNSIVQFELCTTGFSPIGCVASPDRPIATSHLVFGIPHLSHTFSPLQRVLKLLAVCRECLAHVCGPQCRTNWMPQPVRCEDFSTHFAAEL